MTRELEIALRHARQGKNVPARMEAALVLAAEVERLHNTLAILCQVEQVSARAIREVLGA